MYRLLITILLSAVSLMYASEFLSGLMQGARQNALGQAFTGLADDGEAVFYNPAGLTNINGFEALFMYSRQLGGYDDIGSNVSYIGYAQNFGDKAGSFGFRWYYRGTSHEDYLKTSENLIMLGYGRTLLDIPGLPVNKYLQKLSAGITMNIPFWGILGNESMEYYTGEGDYSRTMMSFDIAFYHQMLDRFSFGVNIKDLAGFKVTETSDTGEDEIFYTDYRIGGAWRYNPDNFDDIVAMDFVSENRRPSINLGSERFFDFAYNNNIDRIIARGGLMIGFENFYSINLGGGYYMTDIAKKIDMADALPYPLDLRFDYTLEINGGESEESMFNHFVQLTFLMPEFKAFSSNISSPDKIEVEELPQNESMKSKQPDEVKKEKDTDSNTEEETEVEMKLEVTPESEEMKIIEESEPEEVQNNETDSEEKSNE